MSEIVIMTVLSHFEQHFVPIPPRARTLPFYVGCIEGFSAVGR